MSISLEGFDRSFLDLSSKMTEPFCSLWGLLRFRLIAPLDPQKFDNCTSKMKEIATRVFIGLSAVLGSLLIVAMPMPILGGAIALGTISKALRAIGFALQNGGFTHARGAAPEKELDPLNPWIKIMSWNLCAVGGGMSLNHGGVVDWRLRLDAIVRRIKNEDPDVLILQEVYDTAFGEALIERLNSNYAHFYLHLGPNIWGSVGGGHGGL